MAGTSFSAPAPAPAPASASASASASRSDNYKDGAIFMVCQGSGSVYRYQIYSISFQDLPRVSCRSPSGSGFSPPTIPPPVKLLESERYPLCMGFFSVGSKIYMVGGITYVKCSDFPYRTGFGREVSCDCVYVYDTETNVVTPLPSMLKPKASPFVIGPVEGKVYVHGINLQDHNFELFNPETKEWSLLPSAPVPFHSREKNFRPNPDYNIVGSAVVDNTILLSTHGLQLFSYNINKCTWKEEKGCFLPFQGQTVLEDGQLYMVMESGPDVPLYCFNIKGLPNGPYKFDQPATIKGLQPPGGGRIYHSVQGHVAYLGNHLFCVVRSGYTGSPHNHFYTPPDHFVTFDLFRVESELRCSRSSTGIKSRCFFAVDRRSLSFIMDDIDPEDVRMISFVTPILSASVTKG